jgi:hypothetical protein
MHFRHPYLLASLALSAILIIGVLFVLSRQPVSPRSADTWGVYGGVRTLAPSFGPTKGPGEDSSSENFTAPAYASITLLSDGGVQAGDETGEYGNPDSLDDLLFALATQHIYPNNGAGLIDVADAFSFFPTGIRAIHEEQQPAMSDRQMALFQYANAIGTHIQAHEVRYRSGGDRDPLTLIFEKRGDVETIASARAIAEMFGDLGKRVRSVPPPEGIEAAHKALADGYENLETFLKAVIEASTKSDEEILEAVYAYNSAADTLAEAFVNIATIISVSEIPLSSSDAGSVFVFTLVQ